MLSMLRYQAVPRAGTGGVRCVAQTSELYFRL